MIYLFEDRKDRMYSYLKDGFENDNYDISYDKSIDVNLKDLSSFILSLDDLDILILHKSYIFPDKSITPENVREIVKKAGKRFVLFSGGLDNAIIDENEIVMNSGDFYKNVNSFLMQYRENRNIKLSFLIFSSEKEYYLNQLKKFQNYALNELLKPEIQTNKDEIKKAYKKILNSLEGYLNLETFEEDKNKLEELIGRTPTVSLEVMFSQIQKMIAKYENN